MTLSLVDMHDGVHSQQSQGGLRYQASCWCACPVASWEQVYAPFIWCWPSDGPLPSYSSASSPGWLAMRTGLRRHRWRDARKKP